MPITQISIEKGKPKEFLVSLLNHTMDCIKSALKLPENDTNIRLMEYDNELFVMKAPYKIVIEINMFSGRTPETKKALYQLLAVNLKEKLNINPEELFILIHEHPRENWGVRGCIPASEIELGFKVEI